MLFAWGLHACIYSNNMFYITLYRGMGQFCMSHAEIAWTGNEHRTQSSDGNHQTSALLISLPHLLKSIIIFQTSHPITWASSLRFYKAINTLSAELFQPRLLCPMHGAWDAQTTGARIDLAVASKTNGNGEYMNAQTAQDTTALALLMALLQLPLSI